MKMRQTVVAEIHSDHNPIEAADLGHPTCVSSLHARVVRTMQFFSGLTVPELSTAEETFRRSKEQYRSELQLSRS